MRSLRRPLVCIASNGAQTNRTGIIDTFFDVNEDAKAAAHALPYKRGLETRANLPRLLYELLCDHEPKYSNNGPIGGSRLVDFEGGRFEGMGPQGKTRGQFISGFILGAH